jgi:hypothetical protein
VPTVFEAMLHGAGATHQRALFIRKSTVLPRERLMRRLAEFSVAVDAGGGRGVHRAPAQRAEAVGALDNARRGV